jgi:transcriptional regulator with XRE-family HTH domain
MSTNIVEAIQTRLESMGMFQAQFAECVSATPAQMSIFLRDKGSLSIDSLNKSLDLVGINLSLYSNRNSLAKQVAAYLLSKNISSIDNWTKNDIAVFTQQKTISLLFDVKSKEEYIELEKSGIIDIESTFQYFKALVSYYMSLEGIKPTASQAKLALATLFNDSKTENSSQQAGKIAVGVAAGVLTVTSPIICSLLAAAGSAASKQVGAFSLFTKSNTSSLFGKAIDFIKK